jgi:DNA (cytosine-5)-methyltransferase 1
MACEMDRWAAATHRANFGCPIHEGDVRDLVPALAEGSAEVVFGGPPCQGYSVAGKMDPADPRSQLVYAFLDAVDRVRPLAFVMENVDALARLAKWSGTLSDIRTRAAEIGYDTHVEVLNAADFGVPQARRRMFMWGVPKGASDLAAAVPRSLALSRRAPVPASAVFSALGPAGTERNPSTSGAKVRFAKAPTLRPSPYAGYLFNGGGRPVCPSRPAPTVAASAGGNKTHIVDEAEMFGGSASFVEGYHRGLMAGGPPSEGDAPPGLRRLTVEESRRFQTFPDGFRFVGSNGAAYKQIGNAVPCLLAEVVARAALEAVSGQELMAFAA